MPILFCSKTVNRNSPTFNYHNSQIKGKHIKKIYSGFDKWDP